jgi:copper(I)-binding protein
MKTRNLLYSLIFILRVVSLKSAYADDSTKDIFVNNAWVRAMPPSVTNSAAYMTINNNSSVEVVITSVSSDIAGASEIHQMSDTNDIMRMAPIADLHIPANGKVKLKPGGFHIMLIDLKKSLKEGDVVPVTLHFKDGNSITVNAQVKQDQE